jgi:phage portal protein BeeE
MWEWLIKTHTKKTRTQTRASTVSPIIAMHQVGQPVWTPRRYESLTEEGYQRNVIVYRAVNLIARGAASVPWRLYKRENELLHHPLLDLIHYPNPRQAGSAFIESTLAYLLLSGNSYVEVVRSLDGNPAELYPLRPDRVRIIPSATGTPHAYEYTVNGARRVLRGDSSIRRKCFTFKALSSSQ